MINTIDHIINIDLANKINMNQSINIKQNDTNSHKFIINIFNNSVVYDLTGTTARIYFKKPDGTKVFLDCVIDSVLNNKISSLLTNQVLTSSGQVDSEITIYGTASEILTSVTFNFTVSEVIRDDMAIESTSEFTALTNALNAVDDVVLSFPTAEALNVDLQNNIVTGDALDITLKDDISTGNILDAELKGDITTGDITDAALKGDITTGDALDITLKDDIAIGNVLETELDNAIAAGGAIQAQEVIRLANEVSRVTTESARVTSEGNRVTAESARVTSEGSRVTAEGTRATAEGTRLTNETIRQNNNTAFKLLEVYDNAHSYIPLNKVTYAGSTYQNIVACIGVLPTDITKWILIAQAGTGSLVVSSATNGNIKIDGTETKVYDDASVVASLADNVTQIALKAPQSALDTTNTEITNARGGEINLDTRLDKVDTSLADYETYASVKDGDVYTVVDFKRLDDTLYLKSTLSNKDVNGYFQTCTLNYYDLLGTTIIKTVTWTSTYDVDGNIITKVVA